MNADELRQIFEASMSELFDLSHTEISRESELYCQVKYSYKQGDTKKLNDLNLYIQKENFSNELKLITKIRAGLKNKKLEIKKWIGEVQKFDDNNIWKGEILFSIGYALHLEKKYYDSNKVYIKSYKLLMAHNCIEKGLMALHNAISVIANLYPDKRQFADFHYLLQKATDYKSVKLAALANLNLSIEYQKTGATLMALERIDLAIKGFEKVEMESTQYYLALAQKADLLVDIEKFSSALLILEKLATSTHDFAKSSAYTIKEKIQKKQNAQYRQEKTATNIHFSPTFEQRRIDEKRNKKPPKLGKMESRLVDFLSSGPKDKMSIIKHLYGEDIDYFSLEGRFKSLLVRIRKKLPYSIVFHDGEYSIEGEIKELEDKKTS